MLLQVKDTGTGMTEQQVQQIFKPFLSTKAKGTGLGLTLVQQIVTEHGGHVECSSAVGKGSTFTIFLPLKEGS
jgi:two-component system cell cycle sensor histidine kinase/response regulator CckA